MSYDSSNLTTPDIKWLGVRPSDLNRFNIPQQCRLAMTDDDIKMGKKLVMNQQDCPPICKHHSIDLDRRSFQCSQLDALCIDTPLNLISSNLFPHLIIKY